ncbi:hypothetical protein R6Q59_001535 [Mikania micrantha]
MGGLPHGVLNIVAGYGPTAGATLASHMWIRHAFLLGVPTSQFSKEEKAAISSLQTLFGRRIYEYMIVVFTGGDELDEENKSLEDFLRDSPDF